LDNSYQFPWSATVAGQYSLQILVRETSNNAQDDYLNFAPHQIQVFPGDLNLTQTKFAGAGMIGGIQSTAAQAVIQLRDSYQNVLLDVSGTLVVTISYEGVNSSYVANYSAPSASFLPAATTGLTKNQKAQQTIFDAVRGTYAPAGFYEVVYHVPDIISGYTSYTIVVRHSNSAANGRNASTVLSEDVMTTVLVKDASVTAAEGYWVNNWPYLLGGLAAAAVALAGFGYATHRLYRYRYKYKVEKDKALEMEGHLDEMATEANLVSSAHEWHAVGGGSITVNPLHDAYRVTLDDDRKSLAYHEAGIEDIPDPEAGPIRMELQPKAPVMK